MGPKAKPYQIQYSTQRSGKELLTRTYRLVPRTVTSGPTPNSFAVTSCAVLNMLLVNVTDKVASASMQVMTHLRPLFQLCGLTESSRSSKLTIFELFRGLEEPIAGLLSVPELPFRNSSCFSRSMSESLVCCSRLVAPCPTRLAEASVSSVWCEERFVSWLGIFRGLAIGAALNDSALILGTSRIGDTGSLTLRGMNLEQEVFVLVGMMSIQGKKTVSFINNKRVRCLSCSK